MTIIYEVERKGKSTTYIIREPDPNAAELLKRAVEKLGFKIKALMPY